MPRKTKPFTEFVNIPLTPIRRHQYQAANDESFIKKKSSNQPRHPRFSHFEHFLLKEKKPTPIILKINDETNSIAFRCNQQILTAWQQTFSALKQQDLLNFLKSHEKLRSAIHQELEAQGKGTDLNAIDDYLTKLSLSQKLNGENLLSKLPKKACQLWEAMTYHILTETQIGLDDITAENADQKRCAYTIRSRVTVNLMQAFLPITDQLIGQTMLSKKQKQTINTFINEEVTISTRHMLLTNEQTRRIKQELDTIANRLTSKYNHSKFKWLPCNQKLKIKAERVEELGSLLVRLQQQRGMSVDQAMRLIKKAQDTEIGKHRLFHWPGKAANSSRLLDELQKQSLQQPLIDSMLDEIFDNGVLKVG